MHAAERERAGAQTLVSEAKNSPSLPPSQLPPPNVQPGALARSRHTHTHTAHPQHSQFTPPCPSDSSSALPPRPCPGVYVRGRTRRRGWRARFASVLLFPARERRRSTRKRRAAPPREIGTCSSHAFSSHAECAANADIASVSSGVPRHAGDSHHHCHAFFVLGLKMTLEGLKGVYLNHSATA